MGGYQLAAQLCIILATLAWAGGLAVVIFSTLKVGKVIANCLIDIELDLVFR